MPNEPRDRRATPHARPARDARGASPARVVLLVAVVLGLVVVLGGLAGGALGPASSSPALAAATTAGATGSPPAATASTAPTASGPASATPGITAAPSPSASAAASATPSPGQAGVPSGRLQAGLDALRAKLSVPGVSVAILWDDGRQWLGASGLADVAGKSPVTPDSGFALASISKTFTAAVVLQLVDEGRLALNESAARLLPEYRLDPRVTVRMLLDHTSGLPDFFFNRRIDRALQSAPAATWTAARSWSFVPKRRPAPGTVWEYSNTNYLLLGEIVEAVTGNPLSAEVRRRLLDPLGLADTWYQVAERPRTGLTVGYRLVASSRGGFRPVRVAPASKVMPFRSVVTAAGGAGSIASTALDTARWMRAFAGGRILPADLQAAMLQDTKVTAAMHARIAYGLGIQQVTIAGRLAYGHSGRYLGYRNVVRYLPGEGVTIAVLTNQGVVDPSRIAASLLKIVLPPLPPQVPPASPAPSPSAAP